jgi:endo-alpha-1,4-polygalactosaminidase (GH114 family)
MSNFKPKAPMTEKQLRIMGKVFYEWQEGDEGFRELHKQNFEALLVEVRRLNAEVRRLKKAQGDKAC